MDLIAPSRGLAAPLLALLLLAGCGGEESSPQASSPPATPTAEPTLRPGGYAAHCLSKGKEAAVLETLPQESWAVKGSGSTLPMWSLGDGPTTLVLLPQTNSSGCGWSSFVAAAGADSGVRIVLADICGRGTSSCTPALAADEVAQARMVVDAVRARHRPARLVLGGASAGGAIALHAVAEGVPAAAVIDISGPDRWIPGNSLAADVSKLRVPGLLIYDPADQPEDTELAERAAAGSGGRVHFMSSDRGHGWDAVTDVDEVTLTPEGVAVLKLATGR